MLVSNCVNGVLSISRANHAKALVSLGKHEPAYPRCPSLPGTFMCVLPIRGSFPIIFVNVFQSVPLAAFSTSYISFMNVTLVARKLLMQYLTMLAVIRSVLYTGHSLQSLCSRYSFSTASVSAFTPPNTCMGGFTKSLM